ncbi:hypothetical protein Tco_0747886 [Tanacetum coccineum]|uniref:Uncharacterized protein n=1 Tax=Tanacetum coccineum TaxID=301880 RepID=A0ABQ4YUA2_9ASTR
MGTCLTDITIVDADGESECLKAICYVDPFGYCSARRRICELILLAKSEILGLDNVIEGSSTVFSHHLFSGPIAKPMLSYSAARSDHRLIEDHEKRPMGIFWNLYMSLMYADDVTLAEFSLCAKDLQVYSGSIFIWNLLLWEMYQYMLKFQRCLLAQAQCMLKVYVEIVKSPQCIIVLLTHGFLACNLICCMAFGTFELNGFTNGVWNRFNTMSTLENLSDNWTHAISGVSKSDNGGYLYFYMDCLGNGVT